MTALKKTVIVGLCLLTAYSMVACEQGECDNMPPGLHYKIVDDNKVNLLNFYKAKDIRLYRLNGQDTVDLLFELDHARDTTPYLIFMTMPLHKELTRKGLTFYLQLNGLPPDTLFANMHETSKSRCSTLAYGQVLCNGKPCPEDQSTIPFLYVIHQITKQ